MKYKTFVLSEFKCGIRRVLANGSYVEMMILKRTLFAKLRGALIIEESRV